LGVLRGGEGLKKKKRKEEVERMERYESGGLWGV